MVGVDVGRGESVVDDILVVSKDEGEGAGRQWRGAQGSQRPPMCRQLP